MTTPNRPWSHLAPAVLLPVLAAWAYWPTLTYLVSKWNSDPQYSHGFLVPAFCAYLLSVRPRPKPGTPGPTPVALAAGLALVGVAMALHLAGGLTAIPYANCLSLLPLLAGAALVYGGTAWLAWSWPAILFLVFMIPLPYFVESAMGGPLLRVATTGSTFFLQVLGQPAVAEGNTILLNEVRLGVVEACSGLRMLMTFFAFSVGAVLLIERTWVEKAVIIASAVPIALLTNVTRITATGLVYMRTENKSVLTFFHDAAGWVMMPVGLALLFFELWYLGRAVQSARPRAAR